MRTSLLLIRIASALIGLASLNELAIAAAITWVGTVDLRWSTPGNWSPPGPPGHADDVSHSTYHVIELDSGTRDNPIMINSLTVNGVAGGGLKILNGRGLQINGHFKNIAVSVGNMYELILLPNSLLRIEAPGSAVADLERVSGTIEAVTSGPQSELIVDGQIRECRFSSGALSSIQATLGIVGSPEHADQWLVDSGTVICGSGGTPTIGYSCVMRGTWTLQSAASATFDRVDVVEIPQPSDAISPL